MQFAFTVGAFDVLRCRGCGLFRLSGARAGSLALDRTQFDDAFRALRLKNYRRILDHVAQYMPLADASLLDVGSSSGWFLESAIERGCRCSGIEPDPFFCERARRSLPSSTRIVGGYFARDLPPDWGPFDIITFHDVFEHLDDPAGILAACRERLRERGLLVLSLPSADGFVYRLGVLLHGWGWKRPLERIYQVNYPFPHLFYFTPKSLELLAARSRFDLVAHGRIDGFAVRGSLHRAKLDEPSSTADRIGQYATGVALAGAALVQRLLPPDNIYVILRRTA